jgi:hypothetical protein
MLAAAAAPDAMMTVPPDNVSDVPELNTMAPLRPPAETPVAIVTGPVLPMIVVPDENTMDPETPEVTELAVYRASVPLDVDADAPERMATDPPVKSVLSPPFIHKPPPEPWPEPAAMTSSPPV